MKSVAYVPSLIEGSVYKKSSEILAVMSGVLLLSVFAQIYIPLSWTPVPITGQTFGVSLIALFWGSRRGSVVLASYLALGALGAPVFAMGKAGLLMGPTLGYLIGMFLSALVVGKLSDLGFSKKSFLHTLASCYLGSFLIFLSGLVVLSYFLPFESLFIAGVAHFLVGDFVKNFCASALYTGFNKLK